MKKFFVSKSDANRVAFIKDAIQKVKPSNIYILCENDRASVYSGIDALILPLKELNKAENWITFVNTFNKDSLLVIDNVLKFIYFGDGKKEYLKNISQSINNIIVTDVVPFYTEPHEIFFPFWFLGKSILGYNSYNTFKSNHSEEKSDGSIDYSHSFSVLKEKIADYYVQDYSNFFEDVSFVEFSMTETEKNEYDAAKERHKDINNPILLYRQVSTHINVIESRFECAKRVLSTLKGKVAIVINYAPNAKKYKYQIGDYDYLTFSSEPSCFEKYDHVLFLKMPITKHHTIFYILKNRTNFYQLHLDNNKLDKFFFEKIYNNKLRLQFDNYFSKL